MTTSLSNLLSESLPADEQPISASKQQILDAAQLLMALHGYGGLSMRELAAESGLAKATIYHHFQDKDEIFRQVLERDMHMVHAQLIAAAAAATGAVAKISAVIRTYFGLMQERRTVIMSVMRELGQHDQQLCQFIDDRRRFYFAPIGAILETGIAEGVFRPLNVEHTAISLVGMINAFVVFHFILSNNEPADAIIDHTIRLFLQGICQEEEQPSS
ncbi:MAG: TetR/AcrR family transcriptional regulator [Caldilineaceae bacterium]